MTAAGPDQPADHASAEEYRAHALFHARESRVGIGAAVVRSSFVHGEHVWDCIVSDGQESHYVRVLGPDLGPFPRFSSEDLELAIERFAARLPSQYRLRGLLNANPLHLDRSGEVRD